MKHSDFKVRVTLFNSIIDVHTNNIKVARTISRAYGHHTFTITMQNEKLKRFHIDIRVDKKALSSQRHSLYFLQKIGKVCISKVKDKDIFRVYFNKDLIKYTEQIFKWVMIYIYKRNYFNSKKLLCIHSSLVEINDKLIMIPGKSGIGKTTISNLLMEYGGIKIADDTIFTTWDFLKEKIQYILFIYEKKQKVSKLYELKLLYNSIIPLGLIENDNTKKLYNNFVTFYKNKNKIRLQKDVVYKVRRKINDFIRSLYDAKKEKIYNS